MHCIATRTHAHNLPAIVPIFDLPNNRPRSKNTFATTGYLQAAYYTVGLRTASSTPIYHNVCPSANHPASLSEPDGEYHAHCTLTTCTTLIDAHLHLRLDFATPLCSLPSTPADQLRFWSTTVGRDKTYRTVQYLARFLAWYEYRKGATKETVARLTNLKSSLALSRKRECQIRSKRTTGDGLGNLVWQKSSRWLTSRVSLPSLAVCCVNSDANGKVPGAHAGGS